MSFCSKCGNGLVNDSSLCEKCGTQINADIEKNKIMEAFIGPNSEIFMRIFKQFNNVGTDMYRITWNFSALFFGFIWFFYRKLYIYAIIDLILEILAVFVLPLLGVLRILLALSGHYLYYKHVKAKIWEIEAQNPNDLLKAIKDNGGVNSRAVYVILGIVGVITVVFILFMLLTNAQSIFPFLYSLF